MKFFENNNTLMIGLLIGATIPVLSYVLVETVFQALTQAGIMDEVTQATDLKRKRTLALIALCFNILSVQFFKKRKYENILNGIVTATLIYAVAWVLIFKVI